MILSRKQWKGRSNFEERNSSRLQTLIARVEAKIRNHDFELSAAIAPAASSEAAPELHNHVQTDNANLASFEAFAAVSEYRGPPKVRTLRRGRKTRIVVTLAAGTASSSRSHLSTWQYIMMQA